MVLNGYFWYRMDSFDVSDIAANGFWFSKMHLNVSLLEQRFGWKMEQRRTLKMLRIGEIVASYNRSINKVEYKEVTDLFTQEHLKEEDDLTVKLWFDNGTFVHATIANPFIVEGKDGVTLESRKR